MLLCFVFKAERPRLGISRNVFIENNYFVTHLTNTKDQSLSVWKFLKFGEIAMSH